MSCRKCKRDHAPASLAEWLWLLRDTQPKPPAAQLAALCMLAARLDAKTGCGWAAIELAAQDCGINRTTVWRAVRWAQAHHLLEQPARGRRISAEKSSVSLWRLTLPTLQQRNIGSAPALQKPPAQRFKIAPANVAAVQRKERPVRETSKRDQAAYGGPGVAGLSPVDAGDGQTQAAPYGRHGDCGSAFEVGGYGLWCPGCHREVDHSETRQVFRQTAATGA